MSNAHAGDEYKNQMVSASDTMLMFRKTEQLHVLM